MADDNWSKFKTRNHKTGYSYKPVELYLRAVVVPDDVNPKKFIFFVASGLNHVLTRLDSRFALPSVLDAKKALLDWLSNFFTSEGSITSIDAAIIEGSKRARAKR